jgi:hypothetical protein
MAKQTTDIDELALRVLSLPSNLTHANKQDVRMLDTTSDMYIRAEQHFAPRMGTSQSALDKKYVTLV